MKKRKIPGYLRFVILLPIFWIVFLAIRNSFYTSIDDSDLVFTRPVIPVESNAFWTLLKATNNLYWPDNLYRKLTDLADNTNWNASLASEVLKTNQLSLSLFEDAMQQPSLLVPEPKTIEDDVSYLSRWKELSYLESIQINALHRAGKDEEAFGRAFVIVKFGERVENSGGTIIHYLVGVAIKNLGLMRMQQMTADISLGGTNLTQSILELNDFGPNKEGLTNALKVEYKTQCNLLDDFARGKIPETTNSAFEQAMRALGMAVVLNPRKTKNEFAQEDRFLFGGFSKPFAEIEWSDMPGTGTNLSPVELLISGNATGQILFDMLAPSLEGFARRKSQEDVYVTATQILLALKVYKMQHGNLPQSLSELVPEFFPKVPIDDFDGKPFRYLPDKKIIYSVGSCLKDLGGGGRKRESKDYNLPFKIDF